MTETAASARDHALPALKRTVAAITGR